MKYVGKIINNYDLIQQTVYAIRNDRVIPHSDVPGHAHVSDPTAILAISKAMDIPQISLPDGTDIIRPEQWIRCIKAILERSSAAMRMAFEHIGDQPEHAALQLNVSRATYYRLITELKTYIAIAAAQCGLIRVI